MEDVRLAARILVIEDNQANMDLMAYLLQAFGHALLPAGNGEGGLAIARRERPDAIICDVHLPRLDGFGVVAALKRDPALRAIPVIAVTALAMVGDRERLLEAGFDGYISKPIDPETFIGEIERYLPHAGDPEDARFPTHSVERHVTADEMKTHPSRANRRNNGDHSDR